MESSQRISVRRVLPEDAGILAEFNAAMAMETEGKELDRERLLRGVRSLMEHPEYGFYLLAFHDGRAVGGLMITYEWSDWRNGLFWWIQSVYIRPEYRRQGIYRTLHSHVREQAKADPNVCGLRLYVDKENEAAQQTYQSLGMEHATYHMYEEDFTLGEKTSSQ